MNRRDFLKTSGSSVLLGGAIVSGINRPALAVNFDLEGSRVDRDPAGINEVAVTFSRLELTPYYVKDGDQLDITVTLKVGGQNKDVSLRISMSNGVSEDISKSVSPIRVQGLNLDSSSIVTGSVEIALSGPQIEESYTRALTILDSSVDLSEEFLVDFDNTAVGGLPSGWNRDIHGNTSGNAAVNDTRAYNGDRSVKVYDPDTGAPTHVHLFTDSYRPTGDHTYKFDYYVDGNKNNGGTADAAFLSNVDNSYNGDSNHNETRNRTYYINFVSNGSKIRANDVDLRDAIYNEWVTVGVTVLYSQDEVKYTINGESYGPYSFADNGNPEDYPILDFRVDNYDVWLDNFRQTS